MRNFSSITLFLLPFLVFSMFQEPTFAAEKTYVVYLGSHKHQGREITQVDMDLAEQSHYEFLADYVGGPQKAEKCLVYCYTKHINGFAASMDEVTAAKIAKHPNVISVFPNRPLKLHTTRSWEFLGMEKNGVAPTWSIWEKARHGEGIIIGNLDDGVWPESKSFSDDGYGPVPPRWKGNCTDTVPNGVRCNRKLIGAKSFSSGYQSATGVSFNNTRDTDDGHGTHTLSTAGGNIIQNANLFGLANGTAKGGSPRARVASYKVCGKDIGGNGGCFDADAVAAFDAAIHDGVDILSVSMGSDPKDYFSDALSIGAFHAVRNGILVVISAGNEGPGAGTVTNNSPWLLTVAASSIDRQFSAYVNLDKNNTFIGQSLSSVSFPLDNKTHPLVTGSSAKMVGAEDQDSQNCLTEALDPKLLKGKILVCTHGGISNVEKGIQALAAGAVGLIVVHLEGDIIPEPHVLPAIHLSRTDGFAVFDYIKSSKQPMAYISPPTTNVDIKPAPVMAGFSSQGPNTVTPEILKPDITAPGASIIASFTGALGPSELPFEKDARHVPFSIMSGTSMSCPHVAGVAGLLKALNPQWSPAAIRSAIMTTASTRSNVMKPITDSSNTKATPFNYGAGHIQPNRAMDPGLIYDLTPIDYLNFLCTIGYNETMVKLFSEARQSYACPKPTLSLLDFNYPSLTVPNFNGSATLTRRLKNVGSSPVTYKPIIRPPPGFSVSVEPQILTFDSVGQEKTFKLTLNKNNTNKAEDYIFGELKWTDGNHKVKSQIVVKEA